MLNKYVLIFILSFTTYSSFSQTKLKFHSIGSQDIYGKIAASDNFHRLDTAAHKDIPKHVKKLLTNSAGLFVTFKTTSKTIAAKWCVTSSKAGSNMTPIVHKGLDLYIKRGTKWVYAGSGRPNATCSQSTIVDNMNNQEKECLLYLPLYDETKSLEIGVEENTSFNLSSNPFQKRILIYGSSILQGASASRPGLAYPSILSRKTGYHFINMGLSGSAKMEKSVADVIANTNADLFILDCIPNPSPAEIKERASYLVNSIREKHPQTPIIIIQSIIRETGNWDTVAAETVRQQNENIKIEFDKLKKQGVKKLYFIKADNLIGSDHEGTVDGIHPNDLGFDRMLKVFEPEILKILKKEKIKI